MCGIFGIATVAGKSLPGSATLSAMQDALRHRGPDGHSTDIAEGVVLGNTRLAVIDVEGGRQPLFNESRTIRTVLNGEIYNFRELRAELKSDGHVFRTNSDTEVIVHAYEQFGLEFVNHLSGMFAIALHDSARRRLVLARDHLGIKPLYYCCPDSETLVWGSEIKCILASGLVSPQLDMDSLGQFLSWEYVPGRKTLFGTINQLAPAEIVVVDLADMKVSEHSYWRIDGAAGHGEVSAREWEDEIDAAIAQSVREQMVSDVPLGAFLSGGVDSSLVVSGMGAADTFSIGFRDDSYNELEYASRVAEHIGVNWHSEIIDSDVVDLFDTLMFHLDDPIGDFSIFPTYLISAVARKHVTVALSGDGGDELFGGYDTYLAERYASYYRYLPQLARSRALPWLTSKIRPTSKKKGLANKIKRFVEGAALPENLGHCRWRIFATDALKCALFTDEAAANLVTPTEHHISELFEEAIHLHPADRGLYVDVRSYLPDNCLVKVDRMSMANSLEVRVPLLDKELVTLAFSMPPELKIRGGQTKLLLKKVAERHVPRKCVYRPKEGFSIPMQQWLAGRFRPLMEEFLDPAKIRADGIFEPAMIDQLKKEHLSGQQNHAHVLWSLVVFHSWQEKWLRGVSAP